MEDCWFSGLILQIHGDVCPWHRWAAASQTGRGQHILTGQEMLSWAGSCKIKLHKGAIEGPCFSMLSEKKRQLSVSQLFSKRVVELFFFNFFFGFLNLKIRQKKPVRCYLKLLQWKWGAGFCGVLCSPCSLCEVICQAICLLPGGNKPGWKGKT